MGLQKWNKFNVVIWKDYYERVFIKFIFYLDKESVLIYFALFAFLFFYNCIRYNVLYIITIKKLKNLLHLDQFIHNSIRFIKI